MSEKGSSPLARRSFLTQVGMGVTVFGAAAAAAPRAAAHPVQNDAAWRPTLHEEDAWMGAIPGQHRFIFDTTTRDGMGSALRFASNYYTANANGYGLQNGDLAVIIVARHFSTPFAYNESVWTKYGGPLSSFIDRNSTPSTSNPYQRQVQGLIDRGTHFAVCQVATRAAAGAIARDTGAPIDDIVKELSENLLANAHLVPAGIVAVNRAQERGYAFVYAT